MFRGPSYIKIQKIVSWLAIGLAAPAASAQTEIGQPLSVEGNVSLQRGGAGEEIRLVGRGSERLHVADLVRTAEDARTTLFFNAGWDFHVRSGSLADLAWAPDPNTIYIYSGAIYGKSRTRAEAVVVRSGKAVANAAGTAFLFSVAPLGATSLFVEHGEMRFSNNAGASVIVTSGLASTVDAAGGTPTPPAPPPPALIEEAAALSTNAALRMQPADALPQEAFQRLRGLRDAARRAVETTTAEPDLREALAPAESGGLSRADATALGAVGAAIAIGILTGVLMDGDDDGPERGGQDDGLADDVNLLGD